jgi:C-terminal processing protease CtpA/Prc
MLDKEGIAKVTKRYDERGNALEEAYFGLDGKRVLHKDGFAILRRKFNERGKLIEVAYFDVDEKPVAFKAGPARITHSYNENGRSLGSKYFDKDDHEVRFDVVVTKIDPGTTAERIGLAPQDRIVSYNDVKPTSVQQFVDLESSTVDPTSRRLVIRRDQNVLTFEVPLGRLGVHLDTAAQDSASTRRE